MRALAELIRRITIKGGQSEVDDELRDMLAALVFTLREITATVEQAALAWEKRDYWLKADRFRFEWQWAEEKAASLKESLVEGRFEEAIANILPLLPKVSAIHFKKYRHGPALWRGALARLCAED